MATFTKFNVFPVNLGKGSHDFINNALNIVLTNTLPNAATMTHEDDLTEIASGGSTGYTAGGHVASYVSWDDSDVAGVGELVLSDVVFTGGSATMGPFKYAVLVDKSGGSAATNDLIAWYEYAGAAITLQENETFTVDYDDGTASGALTITA